MKLAAIVLAAGFSRRMGECKLLLPFMGQPLIDHVLNALAALSEQGSGDGPSPLLAVTGPHSPPGLGALLGKRPWLRTLCSPESALGQAASLKAAWQELLRGQRPEGALVLLGDQPLLSPNLLKALLQAFAEKPACIAPSCRGKRGNPVILTAAALDALLQSPESESPRRALAAFPWHLLEWSDANCLHDVDTPEAYAALSALRPNS